MAQAVARIIQQDLSGGMFPSLAPELIPPNGVYDITNGLLDEQNVVYRRGGSSFFSTETLEKPVEMLWSGWLAEEGVAGDHHQILAVTTKAILIVTPAGLVQIDRKIPGTEPPAFYPPIGATTVGARLVGFDGKVYFPDGTTWDGASSGSITGGFATSELPEGSWYFATAGGRLLAAAPDGVPRIWQSNVPQLGDSKGKELGVLKFTKDDYHEIPGGVRVTGMEGLRDSCVVFTTEGIWLISGLGHNLTDEEGNVQQRLDRYSASSILWGNAGVAGWEGGLVIPCTEDIWLMEVASSVADKSLPFHKISDPIRNVYRAHVQAGHRPGGAIVHRGHYFLPILSADEGSVVDLLVCRLGGLDSRGRRSFAWTHFSGFGAEVAIFCRSRDGTGLLASNLDGLTRILELSYFLPGEATREDADASDVGFSVTYSDVATGSERNLVTKARLRYRMSGPASSRVTMSFGNSRYGGAEWGEFDWGGADWTAVTGEFATLTGEAPPDPAATSPYTWPVRRKVQYARVRVDLSGPANDLSLRSLELFIRPDGRQRFLA